MTSGPTTRLPVGAAPAPTGSPAPLPPPPATIRGSGQTLQSALTGLFQGTPGRMRLLGIVGVIAALLLGGAAANAILASEAAAERAANTTEQVVRMQSIQFCM